MPPEAGIDEIPVHVFIRMLPEVQLEHNATIVLGVQPDQTYM